MSEIEPKKVHFTYEERNAIAVVRKSMRSKPEIITEIMKDLAHARAADVLLQAKKELTQLLEVNRAFIAAASMLAKQQKERKDDNRED
jgi:hypothetical protein